MLEFLYWTLILIGITVGCGIVLMVIYEFTILVLEGDISLTALLKRIRKRSWEQ